MTVDPFGSASDPTAPDPAAPSDADVVALLTGARFVTVKGFGSGYDCEEVDQYLDRLAREVGASGRRRDLELLGGISDVRFTPRMSGVRYAMDAVDDFLDSRAAPAAAAVLGRAQGASRIAEGTATGAIAAELQESRFAPARRGDRYDMDGIDQLLDQAFAALTAEGDEHSRADAALQLLLGGRPTAVRRLREGYRSADVDDFLRGIVERLRGI
ncbi:DivIVA domain-containing protein [Brachybacterium sp. MASK1Z-5]|uniref:DivIVA domain-containing protein n=1 Tax=Brachybacterium halotolerans TaxID=2795215 RepID=A0ABS1BDJ1_9MICO|nr:DivIVA domain-containing protein [Brachybacterium halotolerans]MBK0332716.1 DivIVA domain-containing protein [Brachybacterium halotolerans]